MTVPNINKILLWFLFHFILRRKKRRRKKPGVPVFGSILEMVGRISEPVNSNWTPDEDHELPLSNETSRVAEEAVFFLGDVQLTFVELIHYFEK